MLVLTVNVAVVWPAAIETVAGIIAAALSLASLTVAPPGGAPVERVTVPVDGEPPSTVDGFRVRLLTWALFKATNGPMKALALEEVTT